MTQGCQPNAAQSVTGVASMPTDFVCDAGGVMTAHFLKGWEVGHKDISLFQ